MKWMNLEPIILSEVSQKEKENILYTNAYMWSLERWYWWIYLQGSNGETYREQTDGHEERGGEGEMYEESHMETSITICKIDRQWEFAVCLRELKQGLSINLEGWDGAGDEREGT